MSTLEIVVSYRYYEGMDIQARVAEELDAALASNLSDVGALRDTTFVQANFFRPSAERLSDDQGAEYRWVTAGLTVEFITDSTTAQAVIYDLCSGLSEGQDSVCVVKFEDDDLFTELHARAEEIYNIEMKLRRILTVIYLAARPRIDPYNMLAHDKVQIPMKEKPTLQRMRATVENELFYLNFSQYIMLNQRPDPKPVDLVQALANAASFEEFRDLVVQPPVQNEDDAALIAGLASRMDAIENMRNCVAHNRKPSRSIRENYDTALPQLHSLLDDYVDRLRRERLQ